MTVRSQFRRMMAEPGLIVAPGVADTLNARLVAKHGFGALYMTGAGLSAVRLGMPDVGLLTMTEMVDAAGRIVDASGLPVIADADNGYGNVINVQRTIRSYEKAGVTGVHLEDQMLPKRCGQLAGKVLVSQKEMSAKIRAACDARVDQDFVIIARTDAIAVEGFEAAIERAQAYAEAGADMIFVEAPNAEQTREVPKLLDVPLLYNVGASGKSPFLTTGEIEALGYKLVIYPNWLIFAGLKAAIGVLETLKTTGDIASVAKNAATFRDLFDLVGMQEVQEVEARYQVDEAARVGY